ncbi:MAG: hypothetical protein ACYSRQ_04545 [Planctomycetota bacterium]|jgi:hypothetical protein
MQYAFISDGKLFIQEDDGEIKEISSKFAVEKEEEVERQKTLHSWKSSKDNIDPYFGSNVLWGGLGTQRPYRKFRFISIMIKNSGSLFYLLTNDYVTGLFEYKIIYDEELRLFHKNDFTGVGMDYSSHTDNFVAALQNEDESVDLDLLDSEGRYLKTLTGGDSRDSNPTFSRFNPKEVLYQASGLGRSEEGFLMAFGSEAINKVNIETGEISSCASDERYDYLLPKDDVEGNLYFIRRPYQGPGYRNPLQTIWYIVTFPIRFIWAFLKFLDAFTKLFTEKPKMRSGHEDQPDVRNKYVRVMGETIYLEKIKRSISSQEGVSLVPKSWELVKMSKDGAMEVIARNVSSYDLDEKGQIHFTNGFRVNMLKDNIKSLAFKHKIIENIKVTQVTG